MTNESTRATTAPDEPTGWICPGAIEPEFTTDALLAGYWMRKGRTVVPLYAAREPAPVARELPGAIELVKRLRIMAGMLTMCERITFGDDAKLMSRAADFITDNFIARQATAESAPASAAPREQWISVEDRLPPRYEDVFVWPYPTDYCLTAELFGMNAMGAPVWKYGQYVTGFGHETIELTQPVTHWRAMPAAPSNSPVGADTSKESKA